MKMILKKLAVMWTVHLKSAATKVPENFRPFRAEVAMLSDTESAEAQIFHHLANKDEVVNPDSQGQSYNSPGKGNEWKKTDGDNALPVVDQKCPFPTGNRTASGGWNDPCVADVVIVGGGVAGLSAAAWLKRKGLDVIIVEADKDVDAFGRVRKANPFALKQGFDLGGEWLHVGDNTMSKNWKDNFKSPNDFLHKILERIDGQPSEKDFSDKVVDDCISNPGRGDHRWMDYTWWDFFNDEVVKKYELQKNLMHGIEIGEIRKKPSWSRVIGKVGRDQKVFRARVVLVTVPMKQLQDGAIKFNPKLPTAASKAIGSYKIGPGVKAWLQFPEKFYEDHFYLKQVVCRYDYCGDGELFYDEMVGHTDDRNVLGYFAQGDMAPNGLGKMSDDDIENYIMEKVKSTYATNSKPTKSFVMNWSREPFVGSAYTSNVPNSAIVQLQRKYHSGGLYFAGESIAASGSAKDAGFINGATLSGLNAAEQIHRDWNATLKSGCAPLASWVAPMSIFLLGFLL